MTLVVVLCKLSLCMWWSATVRDLLDETRVVCQLAELADLSGVAAACAGQTACTYM